MKKLSIFYAILILLIAVMNLSIVNLGKKRLSKNISEDIHKMDKHSNYAKKKDGTNLSITNLGKKRLSENISKDMHKMDKHSNYAKTKRSRNIQKYEYRIIRAHYYFNSQWTEAKWEHIFRDKKEYEKYKKKADDNQGESHGKYLWGKRDSYVPLSFNFYKFLKSKIDKNKYYFHNEKYTYIKIENGYFMRKNHGSYWNNELNFYNKEKKRVEYKLLTRPAIKNYNLIKFIVVDKKDFNFDRRRYRTTEWYAVLRNYDGTWENNFNKNQKRGDFQGFYPGVIDALNKIKDLGKYKVEVCDGYIGGKDSGYSFSKFYVENDVKYRMYMDTTEARK